MNLARNLERSAFYFPDRPAVREGELEITYQELNVRASRIAASLVKMGARPGDHIGLCAPNSADWITFYFGVLKTGAVAVTLSSVLTGYELTALASHVKLRLIFSVEAKLKELEQLKSDGALEKVICPGGDMELKALMAGDAGTFNATDRRPDRYGGNPLHRRHNRSSQGRYADPRRHQFFQLQHCLLRAIGRDRRRPLFSPPSTTCSDRYIS